MLNDGTKQRASGQANNSSVRCSEECPFRVSRDFFIPKKNDFGVLRQDYLISTRQMLRITYVWPDWNSHIRLGVSHYFQYKEVTFFIFSPKSQVSNSWLSHYLSCTAPRVLLLKKLCAPAVASLFRFSFSPLEVPSNIQNATANACATASAHARVPADHTSPHSLICDTASIREKSWE